jgi:nucleoside-diphosphate-sugar epimerase
MRIALTGATGFLGRHVAARLSQAGHTLQGWRRASSRQKTLPQPIAIDWIEGELGDRQTEAKLVAGCDALVHCALWRDAETFQQSGQDLLAFVERNVLGTLALFEAARAAGVSRVVFVSTGAVHEKILADRPLDETHPAWPKTHYGAHKAAIEAFVSSYGHGDDWPICAVRPTAIYGIDEPLANSHWFDLVSRIVRGEDLAVDGGGKFVHAEDVAQAIALLLEAEGIAGELFECCDRYVSRREVADLAKQISGSGSQIEGEVKRPQNTIATDKLQSLGMQFGGPAKLQATVAELVEACQANPA